jgi:hypothetical protein
MAQPHTFGARSRAALATCHPALQAVAARALELSPVDFTVTAGNGLSLAIAPYPASTDPAQYFSISAAFRQAAQALGLVLRWSGDFRFFADLCRVEIDEPEDGQWLASSPTAALEPVASSTPLPFTSIANGGPGLEKTIAWLKAEEGLVLKGHWDRIGKVWDIGHGYNLTAHGVPDNEAQGLVWTAKQADRALRAEVAATIAELEAHWPLWDDEFDEVRQAVFISGVYQLGAGGAATFKKTIACLRAHDFEGAVRNLNLSKWARQTPNRVGRITHMLLSGLWPAKVNGVAL